MEKEKVEAEQAFLALQEKHNVQKKEL